MAFVRQKLPVTRGLYSAADMTKVMTGIRDDLVNKCQEALVNYDLGTSGNMSLADLEMCAVYAKEQLAANPKGMGALTEPFKATVKACRASAVAWENSLAVKMIEDELTGIEILDIMEKCQTENWCKTFVTVYDHQYHEIMNHLSSMSGNYARQLKRISKVIQVLQFA